MERTTTEEQEEKTAECPSCGAQCYSSDLLSGGEHFVYSTGRLAGYCEKSLMGMSDDDLGYTNDEMVTCCKKHGVDVPWGLDCPLCLADELCDEEDCLEEAYTGEPADTPMASDAYFNPADDGEQS